MKGREEIILNPVGDTASHRAPRGTASRVPGTRRTIGLIDNSKPNVAAFLRTIEAELRARGEADIVNVKKPRSAGPVPHLDELAERCDFVINAVAD